MKRRLFNLLAGVSLLMCVGMIALWHSSWRAQYDANYVLFRDFGSAYNSRWVSLHSTRGRLGFFYAFESGPDSELVVPKARLKSHTFFRKLPADEYLAYSGFYVWNEFGVGLIRFHEPPPRVSDYYWGFEVSDWILSAAFALCALLAWRKVAELRRRERPGLCPTCGYDLRATPERCPECGTVCQTPA